MIDINVTLLIQMVNFLVFLTLMNFVLYRPIRRIVAEREQLIARQQSGIEQAESGAVAAEKEFASKIHEARRLGRERIQDLKAAGYELEKDLLAKAAEAAARQVHEMRTKIGSDIEAARGQLKAQVQAFSTDLAQKILGRNL